MPAFFDPETRPVPPTLERLVTTIDAISEWSGRAVAWLVLAMVLVIGYDVAMRYLFQSGSVALQELEWHLFALLFLLGAAYTLRHDGHVRVDILYNSHRLGDRHRAMIDVFGGLFLLAPFCLMIIITSLPFVANSYGMGEGSPDPGGLPARFLLKAAIPLGFSLLLLQGMANTLRAIGVLLERRD